MITCACPCGVVSRTAIHRELSKVTLENPMEAGLIPRLVRLKSSLKAIGTLACIGDEQNRTAKEREEGRVSRFQEKKKKKEAEERGKEGVDAERVQKSGEMEWEESQDERRRETRRKGKDGMREEGGGGDLRARGRCERHFNYLNGIRTGTQLPGNVADEKTTTRRRKTSSSSPPPSSSSSLST